MDYVSKAAVHSLWGYNNVDWCYLGSLGASRGILLTWDIEEHMEAYTVACSFRNVDDNFEWAFASVCGPNVDSDKIVLWDELVGLLSLWNVPWCIGGDYNIIYVPRKRSSSSRLSQAMLEFPKFIFEHGLMDLPLVGSSFTWFDNRDPLVWSRIDRFLLSPDWEAYFPGVCQGRLLRVLSDHFSSLLDCVDVVRS
jgi:hypothetical protein